jgi:Putative lumazine-binding
MKKVLTYVAVSFALTSSAAAPPKPSGSMEDVKKVIATSYCNGAYNALDTKSMASGFHEDFAILGADGELLERYPLKTWIAAIEARKLKPDFNLASAARGCTVISVDVTNEVASAKVAVTKEKQPQYTDYLLLVHFPSGWRIVSKVYAEHVVTAPPKK